jgi:hypothetical protein
MTVVEHRFQVAIPDFGERPAPPRAPAAGVVATGMTAPRQITVRIVHAPGAWHPRIEYVPHDHPGLGSDRVAA